jgi:hypothetical protein
MDSDGQIGAWIFGGFSMVLRDEIVLAPPLSGHRGSAWLSAPTNSSSFTADINLSLSDSVGGGSFGIWLAAHLGSDGEVNGGPRKFRGLAVLGKVVVDSHSDRFLEVLAFAVDNQDVLNQKYEPFAYLPFSGKCPLSFLIHSRDGVHFKISANNSVVKNIEGNNPPKQFFLGITAMNLKYFTKVSLKSVRFSSSTEFNTTGQITTNLTRNPHISFPSKQKLRSPRFELVNDEVAKLENGTTGTEASFGAVLKVLDEINSVAFDVVSFKELNKFLKFSIQFHFGFIFNDLQDS